MLKSFMFMQWKASRWALAILIPLCLGLPIMVVRFAHQIAIGDVASQPAVVMLMGLQIWLPVFPLLAVITGAAFALTAWVYDHNTNHVYALALPIDRWRYSLLKMSAAGIHLLIAVGALLLGSVIAVSTVSIPAGLRTYPIGFTIRFLLGAGVVFAVVFAMAAGTIRTTVRLLLAFIVIFIFGTVFVEYLNATFHFAVPTPLSILYDAMSSWAGPFSVFGGSWMLIDV